MSAPISADFCNDGDGVRASIKKTTACWHGGRLWRNLRVHNILGARRLMIFMLLFPRGALAAEDKC